MGLTLDENLSLIEKLQRAEERAVAAELLIAEIDLERNSFTGAAGCEDRDGAVERLIKAGPNLTAAREMIAKAEEVNSIRREWNDYCKDLRAEAATLRRQLAEAEALVERYAKALKRIAQPHGCGCNPCAGQCTSAEALQVEVDGRRDEANEALTLTPAAALAEYRNSVLEEVAELADTKATECRRNSECADQEGHPIAGTNYRVRAVSMESFAAEIRAMKEAQ